MGYRITSACRASRVTSALLVTASDYVSLSVKLDWSQVLKMSLLIGTEDASSHHIKGRVPNSVGVLHEVYALLHKTRLIRE